MFLLNRSKASLDRVRACIAFVGAMMLAFVVLAAPAHAWTPADIAPSTGDQAKVATTITHSPDVPTTGQAVNFTGTVKVTGLVGGANNTVDIYISSPAQAPFSGDPTWTGGTVTKVDGPVAGQPGTYHYQVNNPPAGDLNLRFSASATYKEDANNPVVNASVNAKVATNANNMSLTPTNQTFTADNGTKCSGTLTGEFKVGPVGVWLMDTKYADVRGGGNVRFDPGPVEFGTGSNNSITVKDANGNDISATLGEHGPKYLANDPTPPSQQITQYNDPTKFPNIKWIDSMNWNFDGSTMTGDTWLPAGATVTMKRHVTYTDCFEKKVTSPLVQDYLKTVGMTVGVSRLSSVSSEDSAATSWGKPEVHEMKCNMLYSSPDPGLYNTIYGFDVLDHSKPAERTLTIPSAATTNAIAISDKQPDRLYTVLSGATHEFGYYQNNQFVRIATNEIPASAIGSWYVRSLAFDKSGRLWAVANDQTGRVGSLTQQGAPLLMYMDNVFDATTPKQWVPVGRVPQQVSGTSGVDIAFDGNGDAWVLEDKLSGGNNGVIVKISAATVADAVSNPSPSKTLAAEQFVTVDRRKISLNAVGLAWAADGQLYLSTVSTYYKPGSVTNTSIFTIDPNTGSATGVTWMTGYGDSIGSGNYKNVASSDLASCAP